MKKLIITATEENGHVIGTEVNNQGFSPIEVIGILEQVKDSVIRKTKSREPVGLADLLGRMQQRGPGGFNIEDLLGGLPGISGPRDDEDK